MACLLMLTFSSALGLIHELELTSLALPRLWFTDWSTELS